MSTLIPMNGSVILTKVKTKKDSALFMVEDDKKSNLYEVFAVNKEDQLKEKDLVVASEYSLTGFTVDDKEYFVTSIDNILVRIKK
ncbi:hypothetical protein EUA76_00245 [TM7 phylum sp. oral taxon 350]|jgi:chaperonin 10 Kd subunit|nr:hypothetical protein EUA76_00245 [TM7 phylum sp. oral taxon 350]